MLIGSMTVSGKNCWWGLERDFELIELKIILMPLWVRGDK